MVIPWRTAYVDDSVRHGWRSFTYTSSTCSNWCAIPGADRVDRAVRRAEVDEALRLGGYRLIERIGSRAEHARLPQLPAVGRIDGIDHTRAVFHAIGVVIQDAIQDYWGKKGLARVRRLLPEELAGGRVERQQVVVVGGIHHATRDVSQTAKIPAVGVRLVHRKGLRPALQAVLIIERTYNDAARRVGLEVHRLLRHKEIGDLTAANGCPPPPAAVTGTQGVDVDVLTGSSLDGYNGFVITYGDRSQDGGQRHDTL